MLPRGVSFAIVIAVASLASRGPMSPARLAADNLPGGAMSAMAAPAADALETEWSVNLGMATPSGMFRFALCPDGSAIAYGSPGTVHRISARGDVQARRDIPHLQGVRSLDCSDVVRAFRVTADGEMQVVKIGLPNLRERSRVDVREPRGHVAAGLRVIRGEPWLLLSGPGDDAIMARVDDGTVGRRLRLRLAGSGPVQANVRSMLSMAGTSHVVPLFARSGSSRYVFVETREYGVIEFDRDGVIHHIWRRREPDRATRGPRIHPLRIGPDAVAGCAMRPDGTLVVQVAAERGARVELIDATYTVTGAWLLPHKGALFGADATGGLYFGYAGQEGMRIWKGRLPDGTPVQRPQPLLVHGRVPS